MLQKLGKYKHLLVSLVIICFGTAITSCEYLQYLARKTDKLNTAINTDTALSERVITPATQVLIREKYALCEAYHLSCLWEHIPTGLVRTGFNQLTEEKLRSKYTEEDGWKVIWQKNRVILELHQEGLCPEHSAQWHLLSDASGEKVAVYAGPAEVGQACGEPAKITEIFLNKLPVNLQQKIFAGSWEFLSWEEVIATLDSLGEYMK